MVAVCERIILSIYQSSDTAGYDEYVEGVEAEETVSLHTPIGHVCGVVWFFGGGGEGGSNGTPGRGGREGRGHC